MFNRRAKKLVKGYRVAIEGKSAYAPNFKVKGFESLTDVVNFINRDTQQGYSVSTEAIIDGIMACGEFSFSGLGNYYYVQECQLGVCDSCKDRKSPLRSTLMGDGVTVKYLCFDCVFNQNFR